MPASSQPIPRDLPAEPPQKQERRVTLRENWPLPVVVVAHHVTSDGHPDSYPLHIAAKVLSDGQSSRIYRRLVYEEGCALSAFGGGNIIEDPNLFYAVAMVQPGRDVDEAERALIAELERLAEEEVTRGTSCSGRRTSSPATTSSVASLEPGEGDAAGARARHPRRRRDARTASSTCLMKTTAADVQRVARTYFRPATRLVLRVLPPS